MSSDDHMPRNGKSHGAGMTGVALIAGFLALLASAGCGGGMMAPPMLNLSSQQVLFGAFVSNGKSPAPAMVNVTNTGGGVLNFSAVSDQPWLMVVPANGAAPTALQISAALGNLMPNTYVGHVNVTSNGAQGSPGVVTVTFTVGSGQASNTPFWAQWGANPQHTGMVSVAGQNVTNKLADIVYDPFINQEKAENTSVFGEAVLLVHEPAPITDGNDVYMAMKSGTYNSCNPVGNWATGAACGPNTWNTMVWNEVRFSWLNGQLLQVWDFPSDWKPEPNATLNFAQGLAGLYGTEPVFHAAEANGFMYVPGALGAIWKLNKTDGSVVSHVTPFSGVANVTAENTFVSSPLTADSSGNIYYNVIELNVASGNPWNQNDAAGDVAGAWLVKVTSADTVTMASYTALVPHAPSGSALNCPGTFYFANPLPAFPWPPSANAVAPPFPFVCGSQRPGVNIAPVVSADGATIYTASVAHFDSLESYVLAVNSADLSPKWQASLQNRLNDGCGVLSYSGQVVLPIAAQGVATEPNSCLFGTKVGIDPTTNMPGSGYIVDAASSSPTVLPDGSVAFGALDNYNFGRGHLFHFSAAGAFINAYPFGWDLTPAAYAHGATFSVVIKDNHYPVPSYCSDPHSAVCQSVPVGPYYITQINPNMQDPISPQEMLTEWSFQNTNVQMPDNPNGFEWCNNMAVVDTNGTVYVNSEDGNIYQLLQPPAGTPPDTIIKIPGGQLFLNLAVGAAYTPLSIGPDGKLYTQNNGHLFAVGK